MIPTCKVPGCNHPVYASKMCGPHYQKWWKYGDPLHQSEQHRTKESRGGRQPYKMTPEQRKERSEQMTRIHAEKKAKREAMKEKQ